jgi:hypothetical protein
MNATVYISPEKDLTKFIFLKEEAHLYPYSLTLLKSLEVNNIPVYEIKLLNETDRYVESIMISFTFLDKEKNVIGVEVKEFIDIPAKTYIQELASLNNGRPFDGCRWFVIGVLTQK